MLARLVFYLGEESNTVPFRSGYHVQSMRSYVVDRSYYMLVDMWYVFEKIGAWQWTGGLQRETFGLFLQGKLQWQWHSKKPICTLSLGCMVKWPDSCHWHLHSWTGSLWLLNSFSWHFSSTGLEMFSQGASECPRGWKTPTRIPSSALKSTCSHYPELVSKLTV